MSKKFWASRDIDDPPFVYNVHTTEPEPPRKGGFYGDSWATSFCKTEFERVTGIKLSPGEFVQVELKEVSDRYYYED